ncbi:hypothetical protein CMI37_33215 [Candidatus Pacearchaeota archaeon]|nr:hypothetical protein [Candidatus Pacearchaeota archaeon]|tara:strand:- start:1054 stop:1818 length:765 start_codon:yes stop_codon:yes gene_type:complete
MTTEILAKIATGEQVDKEDTLLIETLKELGEAPEPKPEGSAVVEKGDGERTPTIMTTDLDGKPLDKSAGYVYLRRNSDGKIKPINRNNLITVLKWKLADGSPAYLPPNRPWIGKVREPDKFCLLSALHPDRGRMDELNLEVCAKQGKLMGTTGLRRHMLRKHKEAWDTIQQDRVERKEDARFEREQRTSEALIKALGQNGGAPIPQHKKGKGHKAVAQAGPVTKFCEECGTPITAAAPLGIHPKMKAHVKLAHS